MRQKKSISLFRTVKKSTGMDFRNLNWLEAALSHPSYRNENPPRPLADFDRLEFFGDSILNYVICKQLYRAFPNADEGLLSRLRSILVSRKILSRIAKKLKLKKLLRLGRSLLRDPHAVQPKLFTDAFEALLGAYYFDRGLAKTRLFVLKVFDGYFDDKKLLRIDPNPKSTLQEISQKHWQVLPGYKNEPAAAGIKSTVSVTSKLKASGEARTRREAEEKAARLLIRKIRQDFFASPKKKSSGRKLLRTSRDPSFKRRSLKAGQRTGSI